MKLFCATCKSEHEVLIKLGGLICEKCRTLLKPPYSEEWKKAREEKSQAMQSEVTKTLKKT